MPTLDFKGKQHIYAHYLYTALAMVCLLAMAGCQAGPSQREIEATVASSVRATQTAAEATAITDASTATANLPTPTAETTPFQPDELNHNILGDFYTALSVTYKNSGYDENYRLSDYAPKFSNAVDRLLEGENIFLDGSNFANADYTLFAILDREGFDLRPEGYIQSPTTPSHKYGDLHFRLRRQNARYDWLIFKKTAAEILGKEELPLLQLFEDKLYEASVELDDWYYYAKD